MFCVPVFSFFDLPWDLLFLIGNQKVLDALIKIRLSYAVYYAQGKPYFMNQVDNVTGYTLGQDKTTGVYHTNRQGFRGNRDYTLFPDRETLRLAAFGDSFVFCDGEKNEDAWPAILERSAGNLEVLNFGVSGYGFGQSYLRFLKDGLKYNPDIIFFNYVTVDERDHINPAFFIGLNDIRTAEYYRVQFWSEDEKIMSKAIAPFDLFAPSFRQKYLYEPLGVKEESMLWSGKIFSISNLGLLIKQIILQHVLADKVERYRTTYSNEEVNLAMLQNLLLSAEKNHATLFFFIDGDLDKIPARIQSLFSKFPGRVIYANSLKTLAEKFRQHGTPDRQKLLNATNHYNAQGNRYYAEVILDHLKSRTLGEGARKFQFERNSQKFKNIAGKKLF